MGRFTATRPLLIFGWAATGVMTAASAAMLVGLAS